MTTPLDDVEQPSIATTDWNAVVSFWRRGRLSRALILLPVVALVVVLAALYEKPAHEYRLNGNSATWTADVKLAISESRSGSPIEPTGPLVSLPGVGKIDSVTVEKTGKRVVVQFYTVTGGDSGGLVYLQGYPPLPDMCNFHLGGPWWQTAPVNDTTMGCARGFHDTGGG